jgi:c-di-GMP-binding flagellar brake protein YcgR
MNWFASLRNKLSGSKPHLPERRLHPRYKMQLDVLIESDGRTLRARSADVSQSGIGVYLPSGLEIGKQVTLRYQLGDGSPPKIVQAIVRNHADGRYGLEFC